MADRAHHTIPMKDVSTMATEPASAVAAGLLFKAGTAAGAGLLGGLIMAAFDPPASRKELFLQAAVAGTGSAVFGPTALSAASKFIEFSSTSELMIPVYFLVGALSWGAMGALAKFRKLVSERGAAAVGGKVGL